MRKKKVVLVTTGACAKHFGVHRQTVYHWCRCGYLKCVEPPDKHPYRARWLIIWPQRRPKISPGPTPPTPIERVRLRANGDER